MVNMILVSPEKLSDNLKLLFLLATKMHPNSFQYFLPDPCEISSFNEEDLLATETQDNVILNLLKIFEELLFFN
jgi:hypothetical protein